jgi:hypothetical protein
VGLQVTAFARNLNIDPSVGGHFLADLFLAHRPFADDDWARAKG